MDWKLKLFIILIIFTLFNVAAVSAGDNLTADSLSTSDDAGQPAISINGTEIYAGQPIEVSFKDSNDNPISNKNLTAEIDNRTMPIHIDSNGKYDLKLDLKPNKYLLNFVFEGDDDYDAFNQTFEITILKLNSTLSQITSAAIQNEYFYVNLKNQFDQSMTGCVVSFNVGGRTYKSATDSNGRAGFKVALNPATYQIKVSFSGNDYYNSVFEAFTLIVQSSTSIVIGNTRLLTNGYLRIYLKSNTQSAVAKKTLTITVGSRKFTKTTNSEGVIVFKPNVGKGKFKVTVDFKGNSKIRHSSASKTVVGIAGNVKDPLKSKVPLRNGVPDVDLMPANYVLADGDMTYTLMKSQYRDVLKRDSYCLFLNNKLAKYTFFKSKAEPKINHIIKREKWNVIERAINTKIVLKNKHNYWPSQITVSLKGKSYTYAEVRDVQNTGYTCGPTSASMCSQVLKNYMNEKYLAKQAGTSSLLGSSTKGIKKALEKNHFKCSVYYKSSFNKALKQLKKGGCALIFHTWSHYVAILDISNDGKKVLIGNPSGDYDTGSHKIPTKWLTVKYMKKRFNNYDTSGLIVKLKYSLNKKTKKSVNNFYSSMGTKWTRQNTAERIPHIG